MKIEVEIDDRTAELLSRCWDRDELDQSVISESASYILKSYSSRPEVVSDRHKAAMALLRSQAMEQAVRCAEPGESDWLTLSRAEAILNAILGEG